MWIRSTSIYGPWSIDNGVSIAYSQQSLNYVDKILRNLFYLQLPNYEKKIYWGAKCFLVAWRLSPYLLNESHFNNLENVKRRLTENDLPEKI